MLPASKGHSGSMPRQLISGWLKCEAAPGCPAETIYPVASVLHFGYVLFHPYTGQNRASDIAVATS